MVLQRRAALHRKSKKHHSYSSFSETGTAHTQLSISEHSNVYAKCDEFLATDKFVWVFFLSLVARLFFIMILWDSLVATYLFHLDYVIILLK